MKDSKKIDPNKSDRILAFLQSREFTEAELKNIAGAGNTVHTPQVSGCPKAVGSDIYYDITYTF